MLFVACEEDFTPKPRAYPRVYLPDPIYLTTDRPEWKCPYTFEYSKESVITLDPRYRDSTCWYNIYYPDHRATLHLTYTALNSDLAKHIEESRKLAMKHIGKASKIDELLIERPSDGVYGILYDFQGETASDFQFFLTDSTDHFLRGALYFNVSPNKDSLAPVIEYVERDIRHLVGGLRWRS
jgi:gliding motility-associated lipoprotein GldD